MTNDKHDQSFHIHILLHLTLFELGTWVVCCRTWNGIIREALGWRVKVVNQLHVIALLVVESAAALPGVECVAVGVGAFGGS